MRHGTSSIIIRRGMLRASSHYVSTITIFTGPIFFLIIAGVTGDIFKIRQYPWQAYVFLALSGISHFALGRTWAYRSIQLIGSNRSNIVTGLSPVVTIVLAMILFKETITSIMGIGILCTLTGPLLILLEERGVLIEVQQRTNPYGKEIDSATLYRGILYGIGGAVFWGSSAIFIKLGLENGGSPITGSLIAYVSASIAICPSALLNKERREEIINADKKSLKISLLSGLTTNIAQLTRYLALGFGSVIVISLMQRTVPLWVLLFAFVFNRKLESFSRGVLLGNALIIIGTVLILIS
ncbi:MAG: DMT family transporter [Thermodesulfobacteriota bacterium]|nr:DMT family transporter [Thermodesulfobacteriota bacterium]